MQKHFTEKMLYFLSLNANFCFWLGHNHGLEQKANISNKDCSKLVNCTRFIYKYIYKPWIFELNSRNHNPFLIKASGFIIWSKLISIKIIGDAHLRIADSPSPTITLSRPRAAFHHNSAPLSFIMAPKRTYF